VNIERTEERRVRHGCSTNRGRLPVRYVMMEPRLKEKAANETVGRRTPPSCLIRRIGPASAAPAAAHSARSFPPVI